MLRKIIRKILYNQKVLNFFHHNNIVSNYLLSLTSVFQRKFIKLENFNYKEVNKKGEIIDKTSLNVQGQEFRFIENLDQSINLKKMNSVAGYIPFQKNCTQILLYNFFSKNYSIRKQLLGTIYFLKDSKKIHQQWFLMPADCIKFLNFSDLDIDADILIVELFHERIPKNHGLHYGHFRFHGIYNNFSTAHSSPVENFYFKKNNNISTRRYFPKWLKKTHKNYYIKVSNIFEKSKIFNAKVDNLFGDYSKISNNPLGYNLIIEKEKKNGQKILNVNSIYHDAQFTSSKHNTNFEIQLIYVPPIENINATLYFTEALITNEVKANLHFFYNDSIQKTLEITIKKNDEINLQKLNNGKLSDVDFVIVELKIDKSAKVNNYINVHYSIGEKLLDNVHSQCLEDDRCLGYKKKINNGSQGLKWMHFPSQEKYSSYLVLTNSEKSFDFKLRVLFDDYEEKIIMFSQKYSSKITKLGQISINLKELFLDNSIKIHARGIIQLECRNYNTSGYLFTHDPSNTSLSVDHLTGG